MLVGPSMAAYKCSQKLLRDPCKFSKSGCRDLELSCEEKSNVMPGPQSIQKVSPGLATGIPTNTKVNQQPPIVFAFLEELTQFQLQMTCECRPFGGEGHKDDKKEVSRRSYITSRSGDWLVYFQKKTQ